MKLVLSVMAILVAATLVGTATAAKGGPDSFGYTFIDNQANGGPPFAFMDISGSGTESEVSDDDDSVEEDVAIGFSFIFYGKTYTKVTISSNGVLQFGGTNTSYSNASIPSSDIVDPAIFGWWDDLDPGECGSIWYDTLGTGLNRRFIVQYGPCHNDSPTGDEACDITFQIQLLDSTNEILVLYNDTAFTPSSGTCGQSTTHYADNGASASVGIQKDSDVGLEYSDDGSRQLEDGLAICFSPPSITSKPCRPGTTGGVEEEQERPRVNAGGALLNTGGDIARANRERAAAAAAVPGATAIPVITAPRTGDLGTTSPTIIRPPSTGDAGLR